MSLKIKILNYGILNMKIKINISGHQIAYAYVGEVLLWGHGVEKYTQSYPGECVDIPVYLQVPCVTIKTKDGICCVNLQQYLKTIEVEMIEDRPTIELFGHKVVCVGGGPKRPKNKGINRDRKNQ